MGVAAGTAGTSQGKPESERNWDLAHPGLPPTRGSSFSSSLEKLGIFFFFKKGVIFLTKTSKYFCIFGILYLFR